jgi:hypothetical protein
MNRSLALLSVVGGVALTSVTVSTVHAQSAPPSSPNATERPPIPRSPRSDETRADLRQQTEAQGILQRFTLAPRGELDGFLLSDGTQVHLPPHLSPELAAAVRVGDTVSARGYRSRLAPLLVATAITDDRTGRTVVDHGPPAPRAAPPPPPPLAGFSFQQTTVTGRVQTPLYGPAGDLNGAALDHDLIVRLPPPLASQFASLLTTGRTITVRGWEATTAYGRVVEGQDLGPAPDERDR